MVDEVFSRAVVAYLGKVGHVDLVPAEDRVVACVGTGGADLVPRVRSLLRELNSTQPPLWNADHIAEVGRRATAWLHERHPELSEAAVDCVSRHFSFDWR